MPLVPENNKASNHNELRQGKGSRKGEKKAGGLCRAQLLVEVEEGRVEGESMAEGPWEEISSHSWKPSFKNQTIIKPLFPASRPGDIMKPSRQKAMREVRRRRGCQLRAGVGVRLSNATTWPIVLICLDCWQDILATWSRHGISMEHIIISSIMVSTSYLFSPF
jgi:hypothetical protein